MPAAEPALAPVAFLCSVRAPAKLAWLEEGSGDSGAVPLRPGSFSGPRSRWESCLTPGPLQMLLPAAGSLSPV